MSGAVSDRVGAERDRRPGTRDERHTIGGLARLERRVGLEHGGEARREQGAHEGRGLGDRFLKHLDRTKALVHLVDVSGASGRDPIADFETIQRELALFSPELAAKPQIVAATKMDAVTDPAPVDALEAHVQSSGFPFLRISAVTGDGLDALQETIWKYLIASREAPVNA